MEESMRNNKESLKKEEKMRYEPPKASVLLNDGRDVLDLSTEFIPMQYDALKVFRF